MIFLSATIAKTMFQLFKKKKKENEKPKYLTSKEMTKRAEECAEITKPVFDLLHIEMPKIDVYPYLYSNDEAQGGCDDVMLDARIISKETLVGGLFFPDKHLICLGYFNPETKEPFSKEMMVIFLLHEIRHLWQYTYDYQQYFFENAITEEDHIFDKSEIDADAFALAYALEILDYQNSDIPIGMKIAYTEDFNRRKNRAQEIIRTELSK